MYQSFKATELIHQIGFAQEDGTWTSDGSSGVLSYGPYIFLKPGQYTAVVCLSCAEATKRRGDVYIDIAANSGKKIIVSPMRIPTRDIFETPTRKYIPFSLDEAAALLEVRLDLRSKTRIILHGITIHDRDA